MSTAQPQAPAIPGTTPKGFLGAGGFADVFLYEQAVPRRDVAVKVIRQGTTPAQRAHFEAEANLMARMSSHPSILSVYGAGTVEGGRNYLMMEYCPPPHLGRRAAAHPLSVAQALEVGIQVAGAVETIHRAGYLHQDIKPANILLTSFKHPVLTDFGIATPIKDQVVGDEFGGASPPWASPEQQTDEEALTPAADVYSLAATVYTLLSGRSPHADATGRDDSRMALYRRALAGQIPPIGRPDVPDQLERVLRTAMAVRPSGRYPTAYAFARALQQIQTDLHLGVTALDVMEEELAPAPGPDGADATVLRPVTSIDPTGTRPGSAGTRPGPTGSDDTRSVPRAPRPGMPDTPLPPSGPPPGALPPSSPDEADAARHRPEPPQDGPGAQAPDGPQHAGGGGDAQDHADRLPRPRTVLVSLLAVFLAAGVGLLAYRALVRQEPTTYATSTARPSATSKLKPPPGVPNGPAVTDLTAVLKDGVVRLTWMWEGDTQGVTFLYRVNDPASPQPVQETTELTATVNPLPGRTCVEVVARSQDGTTSAPVTTCVPTP